MTDTPERINDFQKGDVVLALLTWGWVLGPCECDSDRIVVHLATGFIQTFHWAECYHQRDVVIQDETVMLK